MRFRLLLLPLLAVCCLGAAKKKNALTVRFHLQASEQDGSAFVMPLPAGSARGPAFVKKVPEISEYDIKAIYPFPAADGTMGCAFKLDEHGRIALDALSVEQRGKVLVPLVNFRVVTAMLIDKRVSDGVIMIGSGLTQEEIAKLQKKYPTLGAPGKKR